MSNADLTVKLLIEIRDTLKRIEAQQGASSAYQWTPEGLPICPKHGEAMAKREKQGDIWYSHQITDPDTGEVMYCKGYSSKSSPGWDIGGDGPAPTPPGPAIKPIDIQETRQPEDVSGGGSPPKPKPQPEKRAQASPHIAQPISGQPREIFYELGSKMVNAQKITYDKFNSLVDIANRHGYERAVTELQAIG